MRTKTMRRAPALLLAVVTLAVSVACSKGPVPTAPGTATMKYGPYTVPAATSTKMGMISNAVQMSVPKPCSECYLTGMQASLINPDGSTANVDQGLWLHHMVLFNNGASDTTCPSMGPGLLGERFFSSGNERTLLRPGGQYGYPVHSNDSFNLIYDLMNMTGAQKAVTITVKFDYVPITTAGYRPVKPVWLDINQCGTSERPAKTGVYNYTYTWNANLAGKLIGIAGHMHDGGVDVNITKNGAPMCDSVATYGGSPAYIEGPTSLDMPGMPHISSMATCTGTITAPVATIRSGDQIKLTANYNSNLHMQMGTEPIMGIAIGYIDPS